MKLQVSRTIAGPPEPIFDRLADHANYDQFRGIDGSELLKDGKPAPNGVGAVRRIAIGPLRFEEDITAFERPSRLDYLITKLNLPFDHSGGSISLAPDGSSTRVEWTTEYRVPVPVLGRLADLGWRVALRRGFSRVLEDIDRDLNDS
jgi:polyketide cyclase/dehydrase/lipid transport protein